MTAKPIQRVLLVGFMGSGKTTVGRSVAKSLGWSFADFDHEVEQREGLSVAEIFGRRGEAEFRSLEAVVAEQLLCRSEIVLASGGGWAAVPGRLDGLPSGTASVWLRVGIEEALRRTSGAVATRPLLDGTDVERVASELLECRSVDYAAAAWTVDTDGRTVEDVTASILGILEVMRLKTDGS